MRGMNCAKPGNDAGTKTVVGGMKTATVGTTIATGTIMTMIAATTVTDLQPSHKIKAGHKQVVPRDCFELKKNSV